MAKRMTKQEKMMASIFDKCARCGSYHCTVSDYVLVAERSSYENVAVKLCATCKNSLFKENEYGDHYPEFISRDKFIGVAGSPAFPSEVVGYTYSKSGSKQ